MLAAVFHAEVVAHRIGEPYGTLVLAVAVTSIEVALIVSVMLSGGPGNDVIRGLAVMGIFSVNCVGLAMLQFAYFYPPAYGFEGVGDHVMWFLNFLFVDGKLRSLFSIHRITMWRLIKGTIPKEAGS